MKLIPKYQNAGLVTRQDNTYVAKPTIPPKLIKRTYTPTQSYVSQDNRSGWQREQGSKKADEEYKKYVEDKKMQQGLENLNGFLNFVDAATIATGVGSVVGKGLRWGGKKLIRKSNKTIRTAMSESSSKLPYNWAENWIDRQTLPSYAKPNWEGDAVELTKSRLSDGGFDRLASLTKNKYYTSEAIQENYNNFEEGMREFLLKAQPRKGKASDFKMKPTNGGVADQYNKFFTEVFEDAPAEFRTPKANNHLTAHEYSHLVYQPDWNNRPSLSTFNPKHNKDYLLIPSEGGLAEQVARGTQIKNYFGLKEGEGITPEMWNYAKKYYVKDMGFDNNMTEWFEGVKNVPEYLKWLNKNAPAVVTPIISSKMIYDNDKNIRSPR